MKRLSAPARKRIQERLLAWFQRDRRDLPWRNHPAPYRVWVSEIMLQQTQVKTVVPYFEAFLRRFPTVRALAKAPLDDVLPLWSGLGYYRRAKHLHEAARLIVERHGGRFPRNLEEALALPGLGRYSAGAVLSIACGLDLPVVDGNVMRVFSRLAADERDPRSTEGQKALWALAEWLLPPGRAGDFNQALMELGARICTPRTPSCPACPLSVDCRALKQGAPERYPVRSARKPVRQCYQACVILVREGRILLEYDSGARWYRHLWHLPFFEMSSERLVRKKLLERIRQRFGLEVEWAGRILKSQFTVTVHRVTQVTVRCDVQGGRVTARSGRRTKWVTLRALREAPLPSSQKEIPRKLGDGRLGR